MSEVPIVRLPGAPEPLAASELVVLRDRRARRYLVTLGTGQQWHSHAGTLDHDALIGAPEGSAHRTSKNMEVVVLRPTREDYVLKMKRGAQVVYPKDQHRILEVADVRPGCTVVEAGAGSGALTLALLDAVGPSGRVISFERREDHLRVARRNVERWHGGVPEHWEVHEADVADHLGDLSCDRVVLDLLEPWELVKPMASALRAGGLAVAYMPTVTQVIAYCEAVVDAGGFTAPTTTETLVRRWDVDGLSVRPAHRMVAHTAFLTATRRLAGSG